jgi:hypothetical protein
MDENVSRANLEELVTIRVGPASDLGPFKTPAREDVFALPAVDLWKKSVEPLLKMFALPAVDLFENTIVPELPEASIAAVAKFCMTPNCFAASSGYAETVFPKLNPASRRSKERGRGTW